MSDQSPAITPEQFEAYLDGRLEGDEALAVQDAIARDPSLAAQLEAQERIDDSIRRQFIPVAMECPAPAPIRLHAAAPARRLSWLVLAAAVVLCAGGSLWYAFGRSAGGPEGLYNRLAAANFRPDWRCSTDAEFIQFQRYRLGDAFLVHADAAVGLIGWSYVRDVLSLQGEALMATVDGEHSVVLVDRLINDKPLKVRPGSGLNLFRKELGTLVLYEITPLPTPHLLDLAYRAPEEATEDDPPSP